MSAIYVPSAGPASWRQFLAKPDLHWAIGYSARTLAHCWEATDGLPPEVEAALSPCLGPVTVLLALPEHKVALPGGRRESQCDVFALLRSADSLVACAVEGKVEEPFGPTIAEWLTDASDGKRERLAFISSQLGLATDFDLNIRYQLLHRAASAIIEADRFFAGAAAMVVHSFSPSHRWFGDYQAFLSLFGLEARRGQCATHVLPSGKPLHLAWVSGDQGFRML